MSSGDPVIGKSSFGIVVKAKYYKPGQRNGFFIQVAVKVMTKVMMSPLDFDQIWDKTWNEAAIVHHAGVSTHHDCVVKLFGVAEGPLPASWIDVLPFKVKPGDELGLGIVMNYESGGSLENLLYKKSE